MVNLTNPLKILHIYCDLLASVQINENELVHQLVFSQHAPW